MWTDGRTDGQTDRQTAAANSRLPQFCGQSQKPRICATTRLSLRSVWPNFTPKEGHEQTNILLFFLPSGTLHEDQRKYICRRRTFATKSLQCNTQYFCIDDSDV